MEKVSGTIVWFWSSPQDAYQLCPAPFPPAGISRVGAALERIFPAPASDGYVVISPQTTAHHCIAWAAGESHRRWEPGICWLIQPGDDLATLIGLFASLGYALCDGDRLEVECQRVALDADNFGNGTHAAR
jgi:hypothetical protein